MVEYGPIPHIRHVHGECLMYKSVEGMYHRLHMAQYRVYDMCRVNV